MEPKKETVAVLLRQVKESHAKKDFKRVVALCDRIIAKNPKNIYGYLYKGMGLFNLKDYLEAEQAYLAGTEVTDTADKVYYQYIKGLRELYFCNAARGCEEDHKIEDMDEKRLLNFERGITFFQAKRNW